MHNSAWFTPIVMATLSAADVEAITSVKLHTHPLVCIGAMLRSLIDLLLGCVCTCVSPDCAACFQRRDSLFAWCNPFCFCRLPAFLSNSTVLFAIAILSSVVLAINFPPAAWEAEVALLLSHGTYVVYWVGLGVLSSVGLGILNMILFFSVDDSAIRWRGVLFSREVCLWMLM